MATASPSADPTSDTAATLFQGAEHSGLYARYRWTPPDSIIQSISKFLWDKIPPAACRLCVDVGCGSGQSSPRLAPLFARVLGCDVSQGQIDEANRKNTCPNVDYIVGSCAALAQPSESVQLVTAFQACHWFDMQAFYREVDRVLCPGGVVALVSYKVPRFVNPGCADAVTKVIRELYFPGYDLEWNFDRQDIEDGFTAPRFVMPYEQTTSEMWHKTPKNLTVEEFFGYVRTMSAYQQYVKKFGEEAGQALLGKYQQRVLFALGENSSSEAVLNMELPYFVVMGRKP